MEELRDLPLELFLYQMGGQLPTVDVDFGNPTPNSQLRAPLVNIEASSFDPSDIIRMQQLGLQESNIRLNEARIKSEEARALQREKTAEAAEQKVERDIFGAQMKYIQGRVKDLEETTDPITGLSSQIKGANELSMALRGKVDLLKNKVGETMLSQTMDGKVPPEKLKEIQTLDSEITSIFNDPKYKKLIFVQDQYKNALKNISKHLGGGTGKVVNKAELTKYYDKLGSYLNDPSQDTLSVEDMAPDNLLFDEKAFKADLDDAIEAFVDGNTQKQTDIVKKAGNALRTDKFEVTDLSKPETFLDSWVEYTKGLPGGTDYISNLGNGNMAEGEAKFRKDISALALTKNPSWGSVFKKNLGSTETAGSVGRSGGGSGSSDGSLASKANQALVIGARRMLAAQGYQVKGDNGANDENNDAYITLLNIATSGKTPSSNFLQEISKMKEGQMNEADKSSLKQKKGLEQKTGSNEKKGKKDIPNLFDKK